MRIDATGNVGIGTTAPTALLEVRGTSLTPNSYIAITTPAGGGGARTPALLLKDEYYASQGGLTGSYVASVRAGLDIEIASSSTNTYTNRAKFLIGGGNTKEFSFLGSSNSGTSYTEYAKIDSSGNFGIGIASPTSRIHVYGTTAPTQQITIDGTSTTSSLKLSYNGSQVGFFQNYQNTEINFGTSVSAPIMFYTNNTEKMRLTSAGNFGIGTASPTSNLHVVGTANITGTTLINSYTLSSTSLSDGAYFTINRSATGLHLSQGYPILWSTSVGNLANPVRLVGGRVTGLLEQRSGVDPQNFAVYGTYTDASNYERLSLSANSSGHYIIGEEGGTGSARPLYLGSNNATAVTIDTAGRVGIGTNSPSYKLHVNGAGSQDIYISSSDNSDTGLRFAGAGTRGRIYADASYNMYIQPNAQYNNPYVIMKAENDSVNQIRVGINTTTPGYTLQVNGSFAATTKSFVIDHQSKPNHKLRHGSLEGPENGVYIRGRSNTNVIELPEYWTWLIDEDSITVTLTSIGTHQNLYVEKIEDNKVYIGGDANINCFYMINAERKDVEKLEVEIKNDNI